MRIGRELSDVGLVNLGRLLRRVGVLVLRNPTVGFGLGVGVAFL